MKKILIVEDDKFLRELIAKKLQSENYQAIEAKNGEEGVQKIIAEKPNLILLDLILPGIDGFEVLKQAKENPLTTEIPVIILSNLGQRDDIEKGLGLVDFLIEPHLNNPDFPENTFDQLEKRSRDIPQTIYALDDESAVQVIDKKVSVVSEGEWKKFN